MPAGVAERYVNGGYLRAQPSWHVEDSGWKARHVCEALARNGVTPTSVLEVGCGAGEVLRRLHDTLPDTTSLVGFDVSPQALELAEHRSTGRLRFTTAMPDRPADLVVMLDVVEHVPDAEAFMGTVARAGEWKVLHVPLEASMLSRLRPATLADSTRRLGHVHFFSRRSALRLVRRAGMCPVDVRFTAAFETFPAGPRTRGRALLWARRVMRRLAGDRATARILGGFSLLILAR